MKLTIAIPTYNRPAELADTVSRLLPQMTAECKLLVIDNCSPVPAAEALAELVRRHPTAAVEVRRNKVNVGGNGNILRCLEECDTEWLWVLGDDDPPCPDAVASILDATDRHPDAGFLHFTYGPNAWPRDVSGAGIVPFLDAAKPFRSIIFISAGVVRAAAVRRHLPTGYNYTFGSMPHVVCLLLALKDGWPFHFFRRQIVEWTPPPPGRGWSVLTLYLGLGVNADLPLGQPAVKRLRRRLGEEICVPIAVVVLLFQVTRGELDRRRAAYYMGQIHARGLAPSGSPWKWCQGIMAKAALRFPRLSLLLIRASFRALIRCPIQDHPVFGYWLAREKNSADRV